MATAPEEMEDLSKVTGALLVNFGTIQSLAGMLAAGMSTGSTFLYGTLLPSTIYSLARFGYFWGIFEFIHRYDWAELVSCSLVIVVDCPMII